MAIQYANLTYSFVVDNYVDLPAGVPPGQLAYVVNTGKAYYSTNGTWKEVGLGVAGGYQPYKYGFDNPPASPSAYDDEFDSIALDAKWTSTSVGLTNPLVAGTISPIASLTTAIYDLSTCPSWLMTQSDNTSAQFIRLSQSFSPGSDATIFAKFSPDNKTYSAVAEGSCGFFLENTGDGNEGIYVELYNSGGTGLRPRINVQNNGVFTTVSGNIVSELSDISNVYLVCWKNGNVYHIGYNTGASKPGFVYIGSVTKTGVTTIDRLTVSFNTSNETPSSIAGIDFIRYYPSITYALMN